MKNLSLNDCENLSHDEFFKNKPRRFLGRLSLIA
jgi:hypothetical protein